MTRDIFTFGAYRWNITAAEQLLAGRPVEHYAPVKKAAALLFMVYIDEAHAATVDLAKPLIIAPVNNVGHIVIDGWHRIYKAHNEGIETLPAHVLTAEEEHQIRSYGGDKGQPFYYR